MGHAQTCSTRAGDAPISLRGRSRSWTGRNAVEHLVLRRFRFPLPPFYRISSCGRPTDINSHHRAACSRAGVLGRTDLRTRAQPREFAERVEPQRLRTSTSATRTTCMMPGVGNSWQRGFRCLVAPSWLWTPLWCLLCIAVGPSGRSQKQSETCGARGRVVRTLVCRNFHFLEVARFGWSSVRDSAGETPCWTSVEVAVAACWRAFGCHGRPLACGCGVSR